MRAGHLIRNISAEHDDRGLRQHQRGGFRAGIRDAARQQQLDENNASSETEETLDRLIVAAKADYEAQQARPAGHHPVHRPAARAGDARG